MNFEVKPLSAGLYFVATPIGTARDITLKALDILASVDVIAAEDTRTARKLMDIHGIPIADRQMIAFHDHSGPAAVEGVISLIKKGKSVAYLAEAGTPLIADPGYELGVAAADAGLRVEVAPGASAVLAALTLSGLPTDKFAFVGFLPAAKTQRRAEIAQLRDLPFTLVLYESPKRLSGLLGDLCEVLGETREVVLCRELTKKFQDVRRGTLGSLVEQIDTIPQRGECVVLVGRAGAVEIEDADVRAALKSAMQTMRVKDAATAVSGALGLPRKVVYQTALAMKEDD